MFLNWFKRRLPILEFRLEVIFRYAVLLHNEAIFNSSGPSSSGHCGTRFAFEQIIQRDLFALFPFYILFITLLIDIITWSLLIILLEEACFSFEFVHWMWFDVAQRVLQSTQQLELLLELKSGLIQSKSWRWAERSHGDVWDSNILKEYRTAAVGRFAKVQSLLALALFHERLRSGSTTWKPLWPLIKWFLFELIILWWTAASYLLGPLSTAEFCILKYPVYLGSWL